MKWLTSGILAIALLLGFMAMSAEASVLFEDDFSSGIDDTAWWREDINGAQWQWSSLDENIHSQPFYSYPNNRYLDIFSAKNDFTNFTLTCDMRFGNESSNQDYRVIYLRSHYSNSGSGNDLGYWIAIQNWYEKASDNIGIGSYNEDLTWSWYASSLTPFDQDVWYRFKTEINGDQIKMKYWDREDTEPSGWLLTANDPDSKFSAGQIGFGNYWFADTNIDNVTVTDVVPEPASLLLFGIGGAAMALIRKKKRS